MTFTFAVCCGHECGKMYCNALLWQYVDEASESLSNVSA